VERVEVAKRHLILERLLGTKNPHTESFLAAIKLLQEATSLPSKGPSAGECELSTIDIERLTLASLLVPAPDDSQATIKTFTVTERSKSRRRWITFPKTANRVVDRLAYSIPCGMPTPEEIINTIGRFKYGAQLDFASYFHQFGFTSQGLVLQAGEKKYYTTTIPTGSNLSPAIAQAYTNAFTQFCCQEAQRTFKNSEIAVLGYIDNVIMLTNDHKILGQVIALIFEAAKMFHISINELTEDVMRQDFQNFDFLGMSFDMGAGTVCPSNKNKRKIVESLSTLTDANATLRQFLQLFGKLAFAATVMRRPRHQYYYVFKWMRRQTGSPLDAVATPWPSTLRVWLQFAKDMVSGEPRKIQAPPLTQNYVVTDASNTGMGAILFVPGEPQHIFARRWSATERRLHINCLEAIALRNGLRAFHSLITCAVPTTLRVVVDNTTVIFSMRKNRSRNFVMSHVLQDINSLAQTANIVLQAEYIKSAENPADVWSRL
jgi:hypothetical protein